MRLKNNSGRVVGYIEGNAYVGKGKTINKQCKYVETTREALLGLSLN